MYVAQVHPLQYDFSEDALSAMSSMNGSGGSVQMAGSNSAMEPKPVTDSIVSEEVLSTLERDVLKRTRQANMVLMRQKRISPQEQFVIVCLPYWKS